MDGTGQDGARLHISGLFVGFVTGLPQLLFPVLAAVFGVRKADNPALLPILIAAVSRSTVPFMILVLARL
jgi:hypothetical protein